MLHVNRATLREVRYVQANVINDHGASTVRARTGESFSHIDIDKSAILSYSMSMPKTAKALLQLPPATAGAIEKLGADLAVARLRRRESLRSWSQRLGVSVATLQRLESGDAAVGIGIVASALWLIGRDGALGELASPEHDQGALEMDVREAVELGRSRARESADARVRNAGR